MKKLGWIIVVILVAAGLVVVRMKRAEQEASTPLVERAVPAVEVASVHSGRVERLRHVTGVVVASEQAQVAPRIMARLLEVRVREGDAVRTGQVLAVLDARELEDAVAQAGAGHWAADEAVAGVEAAWEAERNATARDRVLHEAGAISNEQWERSRARERAARAQLEAARAELRLAQKRHDQARTRLGYAILDAPFGGKITARHADPGDLAVPGKPVLEVARSGGLRIRAEVPVEDLAVLAVGDPVTVGSGAATVEAVVSRIVPATGPSGLAVFEADLAEAPGTFVPGATVGVDVALDGAEGLVVPVEALLEGESGAWVFVVQDVARGVAGAREGVRPSGTVRPAQVQVLARSLDQAALAGPLAEGNLVIVAHPARLMTLTSGMTVDLTAGRLNPGPGGGEAAR